MSPTATTDCESCREPDCIPESIVNSQSDMISISYYNHFSNEFLFFCLIDSKSRCEPNCKARC